MEYFLKKPIKIGEENPQVITSLILREEVVAGDLRGLPAREFHHDDIMKIIGRLSGQSDLLVSKLSFADYENLAELVMGFMKGGLATGNS